MNRRSREFMLRQQAERDERDFQFGLLFHNNASLLQRMLAKEIQVEKSCIVCDEATRERGVFVPTTEREKNVLGASNVFVYALCAGCRPPALDPESMKESPTARIDRIVVRKIMNERTARKDVNAR